MNKHSLKLGVLGGGQLGKMLFESSSRLDLDIHFMDKTLTHPVGRICRNYVIGDFKNYDDVMAFGKEMDVLTIEIEAVNLEALYDLQKQGVVVHPRPEALEIIKDKGTQKQFYEKHNMPTSEFTIYDDFQELIDKINSGELSYPFVQKARRDGYDGKGVAILNSPSDFDKLLKVPSMIERKVDIDTEVSIIACRNSSGEVKCFPMVDMVFNHEANLVEYLFSPSKMSMEIQEEAKSIATDIIQKMDVCGLLAVEFFVTKTGKLLINEVAPRPHNSGHHTIDSCMISQFEQHLRGVLDLPLGDTKLKCPAVMVNLLGAENHRGKAVYKGIEKCLEKPGVNFHLYGKEETRPFRKMGHATVVSNELDEAVKIANFVQENLQIISKS